MCWCRKAGARIVHQRSTRLLLHRRLLFLLELHQARHQLICCVQVRAAACAWLRKAAAAAGAAAAAAMCTCKGPICCLQAAAAAHAATEVASTLRGTGAAVQDACLNISSLLNGEATAAVAASVLELLGAFSLVALACRQCLLRMRMLLHEGLCWGL
jgi:hypothetical protein